MAPVVQECLRRGDAVEPLICLTGQHREMLDQVTDYFHIRAEFDLALMQPNQSLADLTARCIAGLDDVVQQCAPDCLVVQGDTTTVMAAGLVTFYRRVPLVHVEAGLRTYNLEAPWPEELNRRITSLVSRLHCAPTQRSANHLVQEGISADSVHVTGNTVIDALLWTVERERRNSDTWQRKFATVSGDRPMVLITGHRRENFGDGFQNICAAIAEVASQFPEVAFIYPVHLHPNVQKPVRDLLGERGEHSIDITGRLSGVRVVDGPVHGDSDGLRRYPRRGAVAKKTGLGHA